jgi:Tol biopolymer transport system component
MSIGPGTRLGPYEVTALIGEGDMGKVWRAHHTALKRDDALKVLPDAFATDVDRLARFRREAQVLASLNHPNIAHVYGLEQSDGVQALVMELVEGPTLADRIALGPIPLDEALPIAKQIADALEAAHEQGIIHRDLKPANVKVRPDGTVKVLDFGLAKALEPMAAARVDATASPTMTSPAMMTGVGVLLGTAAYMSPEQARGKAVDRRSDVWALGCVVYEMVAGQRAFAGDDVADVLANVLKTEPNWSALPPYVPSAIRILLQRCLTKDRARRVADAGTVAYVIEEASSLTSSVNVRAVAAGDAPPQGVRRWLIPVTLAAFFMVLVGAAIWSFRPSLPSPRVTRFGIADSGGQLTTLGRNQMAVSPDGTHLVYYRGGQAFLRDLSEFDSHALPGGVGQTAFSPDGRSLAVYSPADGTIKRMDVGGGAAVALCRADNVFGMTWDASGIISGQGGNGILRCPLDGGTPEQLARVEDGEEADRPQILPGGETLLFTIAKTADGPTRWDNARIVVESLTFGSRRTIVEGGSSGRYVPSGHILYARGGIVHAISFDVARGEVRGQAEAVISGVRRVGGGVTGAAQFAVSDTGHLFYIPGPANTGTTELAVAVADRAGMVRRLGIPPGPYVLTRVSRDGTHLAVGSDNGKEADIWMYRLGGTGALQRLTLEGRNRFPIWSSDGSRVAFQSDRDGDQAIFAQGVDGTERAARLTKPGTGESHVPESWSPDGRHMLVSVVKGSEFSLWILSAADGVLAPFGVTTQEPTDAVFSPDGRWVAYRSSRSSVAGLPGVFVQPFPPTGAAYPAPKVGIDFHPVWAQQGAALVYVPSAASVQLATVTVTAKGGVTFGAPVLSPATVTADRINSQRRAYDILPDGQFIGLVEASERDGSPAPASREIRVVLNWFEELKRLVPTP